MHFPVQEHFSSFGFVTLMQGQQPVSATTTFPSRWHQTYFENKLFMQDPIFAFAAQNVKKSTGALLSQNQMSGDLFDAAREFDAASNFVSVSHFAGSSFVFGGVNPDLTNKAVPECQRLCQATHRLALSKRIESLTDTQIDLLEMAEEGFLDKEIAEELGVSMSAIAQRKKAICNHVGVTSFRASLQLYALDKWGGIVASKSYFE